MNVEVARIYPQLTDLKHCDLHEHHSLLKQLYVNYQFQGMFSNGNLRSHQRG